ncbi:MAG: hypothetical protein L7R66_03455 [Candidatus Thalassarchaeaceae archaeon]|nr:hypothetical protein [Candidatus Thalassarchaeaceae archaeon]
MHLLTKATFGLGTVILVLSIFIASNGWSSMIEDVSREEEGSTEVWSGKSFSTYEGELSSSYVYPIFVQELRSVDVELLDGDALSRFVPCEEDNSCNAIYEPGYTYVGYVDVFHSGTWRIKFSGDVIGDSDVMIRGVPMTDDGSILQLGLGCSGICISFLLLGTGIVFALTLKERIRDPLSSVTLAERP